MKTKLMFLVATLGVLALSGCFNQSETVHSGLSIRGDTVQLQPKGERRATISADGELRIAGHTVPTTPAQRALLVQHHHEVMAMVEDGKEVGKAGAALALQVARETATNALQGREFDEEAMEARVRETVSKVAPICQRLITLHQVQDQLATEIPAFRPYATIDPQAGEECAKGLAQR